MRLEVWLIVGDLVYTHNYWSDHQWTAAIITKLYGRNIYYVETGKNTWVHDHKQLRPRRFDFSICERHRSLNSFDDIDSLYSVPYRSLILEQPAVLRCSAKTRKKQSRYFHSPTHVLSELDGITLVSWSISWLIRRKQYFLLLCKILYFPHFNSLLSVRIS